MGIQQFNRPTRINKGGRPSKFDADRAGKIVTALEEGCTIAVAVRAAGVGRTTFKRWIARGRSHDPADEAFRAFRTRVTRARAKAEADAVQVIRQAAHSGNWTAAAWLLERSYPKRWGRIDRVKATVISPGLPQILCTPAAQRMLLSADPDVLDRHCEEVARRLAPPSLTDLACERDARLTAPREMSPLGDISTRSIGQGVSVENNDG